MTQKPVKVQSVMRALQLFEILMRANAPMSAIELSQQTGLNRSTVHSLLDTLIACDYVERETSYGKYFPTIKMYALSRVYADRLPLVRICVPIARTVAEKYNLALNFGVLAHDDALYIIKEFLPSDHSARNSGYNVPFHATAIGKLNLAFLPAEQTKKLLDDKEELEPYTQYTIRDKETLYKQLEIIRKCGYSTVRDEFAYGHTSFGFPVFDANNNLVCVFSFNTASDKVTDLPESFLNEALQASRDCSIEMGCPNPPVFFPEAGLL